MDRQRKVGIGIEMLAVAAGVASIVLPAKVVLPVAAAIALLGLLVIFWPERSGEPSHATIDFDGAITALIERRDAALLDEARAEAEQRSREAAEALLAQRDAELVQQNERIAHLVREVERLELFEQSSLAAATAPRLDASIPIEENRSQVLAVWVYPGPHDVADRTLVHADLSGISIRNDSTEPVEVTRMWLAVLNPETGREEWPHVDDRHNREELEGDDRIRAHDQQVYGLGVERIFGVVIPREERARYIKLAVASSLGEFRYELPEEVFFSRERHEAYEAALGGERVPL